MNSVMLLWSWIRMMVSMPGGECLQSTGFCGWETCWKSPLSVPALARFSDSKEQDADLSVLMQSWYWYCVASLHELGKPKPEPPPNEHTHARSVFCHNLCYM